MPEEPAVELVIDVKSNTDRLSATAVHGLVERLVDRFAERGEETLRANVFASVEGLWGRTGELEGHVDRHPTISVADTVTAEIGIPPIESARAREHTYGDSDPADYPLFKDQGTRTPITPAVKKVMKFEGLFGETVYRESVHGQEGADFSRHTYEQMFAELPHEVEQFEREIKALV